MVFTSNYFENIDITDDPYIMSETDLNACKATESSLWEIKTLQSHVLPEIANTAKFIDRDLPKLEWDVSQDLETTLEDVSLFNNDYSNTVILYKYFESFCSCWRKS